MLWIGRMNRGQGAQPRDGRHARSQPAARAHRPVQSGQRGVLRKEVEPHIDGDRVEYVGEVGEEKAELYVAAPARS